MRPEGLISRIFLDTSDPKETREILNLLGFLDGQTTNPTSFSKNPEVQERLERGEKFTKEEIYKSYRAVVEEISKLIPNGSVSVEVYADRETKAEEMFKQAKEMFSWIPNAHIKFPITSEGLTAVEHAVQMGLRVNMTLCFSQEQAAAAYAVTRGAKRGNVFVSPFIGRLDERGENGMDLIVNIIQMYQKGDRHVEVLTASVRNLDHLLQAIKLRSDIITARYKTLKEWGEKGLPMPDERFIYNAATLRPIPYVEIDLNKDWQEFNIQHELTDKGIEQFSYDWNTLIEV